MEEENNMDGIEANIFKKMLIPASGFVEALLGPKIEKIMKNFLNYSKTI